MDSIKQVFIAPSLIILVAVFGVRGIANAPESSTQVTAIVDVSAATPQDADWTRVALGAVSVAACVSANETWMRNGVPVAKFRGARAGAFQSGTSLTFLDFQPTDAGRYECIDAHGTVGKIHTFYQDVSISEDTPAQLDLAEGMIGGIACHVLGGGNISKTLYRVKDSTSHPVDFVNENFEWTRKVEKGDAGEYICSGTQTIEGDKKTINKNITLIVKFAPEIAPADVMVSGDYPQRSITLSCPVVAVPAASLKWFNVSSGTEQELSELASMLDGKVTFPMSNLTDTVVKCTATNDVGDSSRVFTVPHLEPNRENVYPNVTSTYKNGLISHGIKGENGTIIAEALAYASPPTNAQDVTKVTSSQTSSAATVRFSAFLGLFLMVLAF